MDKYQETFNTWNKIAKVYEDKFMDLDLYNDTYDVFLDLILKTNASILEIGCGPANISKYLLTKNPDLKIKGIDISENMVSLARKNNPSAEFEIMDIRKIHDITDKFDAVICGFSIPYISQQDCLKLIADCKNLLHDSGILYLSFVNGDYKDSGFISGDNGDRTYFYYHNLGDLKKILETNSFEINKLLHKKYKKTHGTEDIHTIIISIKRTKKKKPN